MLDRSDPPALRLGAACGCVSWNSASPFGGVSKRLSSFRRSSRALKQAEQRLTGLQIKSPAKRLSHHATPVAC